LDTLRRDWRQETALNIVIGKIDAITTEGMVKKMGSFGGKGAQLFSRWSE
jgi:hypothetical protein